MEQKLQERCAKLGVNIPTIYLPQEDEVFPTYAVIACDQFSSERKYWDTVEEIVQNTPSTFRMILPEAYLQESNRKERMDQANTTMATYLNDQILGPLPWGFVLVERTTPYATRRGIVLAIDLEKYSFEKGSRAFIRPTEGTILDRLPPRMDIRRGALLDLPHILLLVDDPQKTFVEPLYAMRDKLDEIYRFDLMQKGGSLTGWHIPLEHMEPMMQALEKIMREDLLFAVGDGNHSLAAAKQLWEEKKSQGAPQDHPARYALVEVENIYDPGVIFHPIHRVLFHVESTHLLDFLKKELRASVQEGSCQPSVPNNKEALQVGFILGKTKGILSFSPDTPGLPVEFLQDALDTYLEENPEAEVDYIHGADSVAELAAQEGTLGLILPEVDKDSFFQRIQKEEVYPRKTFSIGEAVEKRYYLEARKLTLE